MKNKYLKFLIALFLFVPSLAFSQCNNVFPYGSAVAPSVVNATATIFCNFAEEWGTWSSCLSGNAYRVTSTIATDFITVRSGSSGGPVVAKGVQPLSFSPSTSGTLYIHINTNSSCGTQQSCRDITMQLLAPCLHTSPYGSAVAPTSGTPITVTTCAFGGEYTTITGAAVLATYTTASSVGTDHFTIRSGSSNGPVVAVGQSPITWTALSGGTYYQHCSSSAGCATAQACRTITILCQSCFTPPPPTPPANDLCANATALAIPSTTAGTTVNATVESPAPPTCVTSYSQPGVWYTVVGNGNQLSASLCNTVWDSKIFVYTGICGSFTCVTGNDDNGPICAGSGASVNWCSTLNTTYRILVTGYFSTSAFTLDIATVVVPTPVVTPATVSICAGASTTLVASGSSTYTWNPGNLSGASQALTPATTTTYTVTGTDATTTCSKTATATVTVNPSPVVTTTATATSICIGASTTITASGAATYTWMPGNLTGGSVTVSPTSTTTYTVTGTNAQGCTNTSTRIITVNPLPVVTATSSSAAVCAGGSVTLTGGGATSYVWNNNVVNAVSFVPTATATYMVTGTDANGCVNTAMTTVTVNPLPTVTATSSSAAVCAGGSVTLTGGGASTYAWDNNVTDAVSFVPTATTTYMVTGTDANGCVNTAMTTVTVNPLPTVTATSSSAAVCAGGSVTLTGGGASTYAWDNNVTDAVSFVPTATTTYMVTGTDANGCVNTAMVTVTVNALPTVTATSSSAAVCAGDSVALTGGGTNMYAWDNNVMDGVYFIPTATTTYMVTGTDSIGCSNTAMVTVTVNALPTVTATSSSAAVCAGDSVILTGGGTNMYMWDNNVMNGVPFMPIVTTTYMVTGTDSIGCSNTAMVTVTVNALPTVTATSSSAAVCSGDSVMLTGGGASTYAWDNNVTDAVSFVPTATATYMVTGTDSNGCVNTASTTVAVNALPTVSLGPDTTQCGGTVVLDAGNIGAIYLWSDLSTSQTNTVSASGSYTVIVTDVNLCMGMDDATITINANPTVTASASSVVVCVDDASVTLTGTPTGGAWTGPGVTGSNFDPATAGLGTQVATYNYTDSIGCSGTASVSIQVDACIGFVENTLENGVSVYPNPNNGSFTLSVNANVGDLTIKITDMQGRVVYASVENNVNAGFVKQISLDTQSSGMYLMHILANGEQQTKKIAVQK